MEMEMGTPEKVYAVAVLGQLWELSSKNFALSFFSKLIIM
jgi:hypothetical protein